MHLMPTCRDMVFGTRKKSSAAPSRRSFAAARRLTPDIAGLFRCCCPTRFTLFFTLTPVAAAILPPLR
jgi:hypothetical protein